MRNTLLLVLLLSHRETVIASVQLVQRQEQGFWPDLNWGDIFLNGINLFRGGGDVLPNLQGPDSSKTNPPPVSDTPQDEKTSPESSEVAPATGTPSNENASPEAAPISPPSPDTSPAGQVYNLNINNDPSSPPNLDLGPNSAPALPAVREDCDPMNVVDAGCGKTTDQLIFTLSCVGMNPDQLVSDEAKAQNQAIRDELVVMNGQNVLAGKGGELRISMSHICDVVFFAVPLTENQIQEIEKKPGVKSVRPNQDLPMEDDLVGFDQEDSDPSKPPVLSPPRSRLRHRDRVIVDPTAGDDLRFISTPRYADLSSAYFYYSNAGRGVTIIAVDSGVNILHDDFVGFDGESSLHEHRIYALDTVGLAEDYDDLGTCRISKMVGRTHGVAKKAKVLVAMTNHKVSSLIDVFVQVLNYLNDKSKLKEKVGGYYVMSIMLQWDNDDHEISATFEGLLRILQEFYQVVVVVQAGLDHTRQHSDVIRWPATAERRNDIIVVGAIHIGSGRAYPFSRGGPFVSVMAPGLVKCAQNRAGSAFMKRRGTDVAAAEVAGLVAYLLSLDDVGPRLRRFPKLIPQMVKKYVMNSASYPRLYQDDVPAIWNQLGIFSS